MEVIGAPAVRTASLTDEYPQTPAAGVGWQESIALVWFDPTQGKGVTDGFHDSLFALQTPCVIRLGKREGICFFETSANPYGGHAPPKCVINGVSASGLTTVTDAGNIPRLKPLH